MTTQDTEQAAQIKPVKMSDEAHHHLTQFVRKTSGLATATLTFGKPRVSPFASFNRAESEFTANPERLVINPNRVYLTVTPFRMRQEAVLTGALLHESAHARHTRWTPTRDEERAAMRHGINHVGRVIGEAVPVSKQTLALAKLMEEPRIEGIMATEADSVGAFGLGWTMRAAAAHLIPTTSLTVNDPGQRIMDLITSWVLRAGRQLALREAMPGYVVPQWVGDFTNLLHTELAKHIAALDETGASDGKVQANVVQRLLTSAITSGEFGDTGTFMVDTAREVLVILFPETTGAEDDAPMPGDPMHSDEEESGEETEEVETPDQNADSDTDSDAGSDEGDSEGDSDETGEGSEDGQGEGESDDPGSGEGEGQGEADSPGDQPGDSVSGEGEGTAEQDATAAMLASIEAEADNDTAAEAEAKTAEAPPVQPKEQHGAGAGVGAAQSGWRDPNPSEREVAKGAERFLRTLINPSETSRTTLSESPSASVDGQALAVWKAGGQKSDPMFFRRTRRQVTPAPPVKIAILVDVSQSMEALQKPSAVLSWALANSAIDLRNFAGRGVQVESTLIHWGDSGRVIQGNGRNLPGIREVPCAEGTSALNEAMDLVDEEIPGFFDTPERPEHRLLVQFTDWELHGLNKIAIDYLGRGLSAGVNMLSVVPSSYSGRRSALQHVLGESRKRYPAQRGRTALIKYDERKFSTPADVWAEAKQLLS